MRTVTEFDVARCLTLLKDAGATLGFPLNYTAQTESTNDQALAAAQAGAAHGSVFLAESQTRGRGRRGRSWWSPPGENLTFSVVLRSGTEREGVAALTLIVGLAVRDAIAGFVSQPVTIKWPNDIWVEDKKVAGILLEANSRNGRVDVVIAGVGINCFAREMPDDFAVAATSLALLQEERQDESTVVPLSRERLLAAVLSQLSQRLTDFSARGLAAQLSELSQHDALLGRQVRVDALVGTARGFAPNGALVLETDAGEEQVLAGTVELLE